MGIYDIDGKPLVNATEITDRARELGLHATPNSLGELNAVRRARQLTDIKWTPCTNRHRGSTVDARVSTNDVRVKWFTEKLDDLFLANTEYKGVPYSRGDTRSSGMPTFGKPHGYVGFDVPLSAFATACRNPDTYFSTLSYYSGEGDTAAFTPYGVTCDTLVCYALGFSQWYGAIVGFQTLENNGTIVIVCDAGTIASNFDKIHLGDILWEKGEHVSIITDFFRDENDTPCIEVAEATTRGIVTTDVVGGQYGGVSRRELFPLDQFNTRFSAAIVYRYINIDDVEYEQSPYVTLDGETPLFSSMMTRLPLMPYMGEGFAYVSGKIPNSSIVISSSSYDYMAVYKDGTLFNTFAVNGATSISVGFSAVGNYEAFLYDSTDGTVPNATTKTISCHWSVVSA